MSAEVQYKSGSNLEKVLAAGSFAVTAELGPPKSADLDLIRKKAELLRGCVDAVNVTDNQTAIVRVSSLAVSKLLVDLGLEPVMQMTCRDRNRLAMQADILGAHLLGVRNLVCLTGDHQCFGNHPTARYVYDLDSVQLIQMVRNMRDKKVFACGEEIRNTKKSEPKEPRMFIGGAANPFADPFEFRVHRLAKKINAGADFVQTQCIYNMNKFRQFMKMAVDMGLTEKCFILAGVTPLKSVGMAQYMAKQVPGMDVPPEMIDRLKGAGKGKAAEEGIRIAIEQIEEFKEMKGVAGVHLMAIEWEHRVAEIAERAKVLPRPIV